MKISLPPPNVHYQPPNSCKTLSNHGLSCSKPINTYQKPWSVVNKKTHSKCRQNKTMVFQSNIYRWSDYMIMILKKRRYCASKIPQFKCFGNNVHTPIWCKSHAYILANKMYSYVSVCWITKVPFLHCWHSNIRGPFYKHGLTLIPAGISNHISSKLWDEITYPSPNFNYATVEIWECINNFIPHFIRGVLTYPWWN